MTAHLHSAWHVCLQCDQKFWQEVDARTRALALYCSKACERLAWQGANAEAAARYDRVMGEFYGDAGISSQS